jgi:hypothetical protein
MMSAEAVDCRNLETGSVIDVETRSRHYQIECLGGNIVRISGHPEYCPVPVPALLHGSINDEGSLEPGLIGPGMRLVFTLDDHRPVTTTTVTHVHVDTPFAPNPHTSLTVQ